MVLFATLLLNVCFFFMSSGLGESYPKVHTTVGHTTPPKPQDMRLPLDLYPLHYNVELQPDIYSDDPKKFTFNGSVDILFNCTNVTNVVIVHIQRLTVNKESLSFQSEDGSPAPSISHTEEDKKRHFYKVYLSGNVALKKKYTLSMRFMGPLAGDGAGLYRSSYKEGNRTIWLATTQFQPTDARKAFPCLDEPAIKSTFNIILVRKSHMKSLSNMPILSSEDRGDNWIADRYQSTVKMSTYLLAFIVCDFVYKEGSTANGTVFRVWARRDALYQAEYALKTGINILQKFETYFGIPYPLPKQDMIAIPDLSAGAMENWGLITYRETALLYDPNVSATSNKQRVAAVVSHELAHQWFGNLVTPSWWDDLWLNEGFARYLQYIGVDFEHPQWKMMDQFIIAEFQDVFRSDDLGNSHPLFVPVNHPHEINGIFDPISYAKGGSIIRMMNKFLTESTFRKGLIKYLKRHAYANAFHDDLWNALTEQARADGKTVNVKRVMDTWLLQIGYPVVNVTRTNADTATVTQKHFLLDPSQTPNPKYPSPFGYKWVVPFTYTTDIDARWDDANFVWMDKSDVSLTGIPRNAKWIVANTHQQGYYRVNYDLANWHAIINQLKTSHTVIPVKNRAQIIDDAFMLGRSGEIDQLIGLKTTEYLENETEYLPWSAARRNLDYIDKMLGSTSTYGLWQKYMKKLTLPVYNRVGWTNPDNDPVLLKISPDLRRFIYCYAIRNGGAEEWDFVYEQYKKANVAVEKIKLLYGLSCSREPWILSRYLNRSLNPNEIRKKDTVIPIRYISGNRFGRSIAWDFLRTNWRFIIGRYGPWFFFRLVSFVVKSFNTQFESDQLTEFMAKHPKSRKWPLKEEIDAIKRDIKWLSKNEGKIKSWLETKV